MQIVAPPSNRLTNLKTGVRLGALQKIQFIFVAARANRSVPDGAFPAAFSVVENKSH